MLADVCPMLRRDKDDRRCGSGKVEEETESGCAMRGKRGGKLAFIDQREVSTILEMMVVECWRVDSVEVGKEEDDEEMRKKKLEESPHFIDESEVGIGV